jgi:hypothetical protein
MFKVHSICKCPEEQKFWFAELSEADVNKAKESGMIVTMC